MLTLLSLLSDQLLLQMSLQNSIDSQCVNTGDVICTNITLKEMNGRQLNIPIFLVKCDVCFLYRL